MAVQSQEMEIRIRVWHWDDADFERHRALLTHLSEVAVLTSESGLTNDEIEDDLLNESDGVFEDVVIIEHTPERLDCIAMPAGMNGTTIH